VDEHGINGAVNSCETACDRILTNYSPPSQFVKSQNIIIVFTYRPKVK